MRRERIPEAALDELLGVAALAAVVLDRDDVGLDAGDARGLAWLARALRDRAEAAAACFEARPPRWHVFAETFATVDELRRRGLLPSDHALPEAAE